ncbi:hypothetical protein OTU49_006188, partial [Cherax quadricarinatus]
RLWAVSVLQEGMEVWSRSWLVDKFRSPYMCRVSVKIDEWCMVPSLTHPMMRRLPAWKCVYDPWCDALVYIETAPPLITRLTVLMVALAVSILLVWAPRLFAYRPSHPYVLCVRRNTPRRVLVLAALGALFQLLLDHCLIFVLPPHLQLSRITSFIVFCCSTLLMTVVLVVRVQTIERRQPYTTRALHLGEAKTIQSQPRTDAVSSDTHSRQHSTRKHADYSYTVPYIYRDNILNAAYTLPEICQHLVTDNTL